MQKSLPAIDEAKKVLETYEKDLKEAESRDAVAEQLEASMYLTCEEQAHLHINHCHLAP